MASTASGFVDGPCRNWMGETSKYVSDQQIRGYCQKQAQTDPTIASDDLVPRILGQPYKPGRTHDDRVVR